MAWISSPTDLKEIVRLRAALAKDEVEITALTRERDEARKQIESHGLWCHNLEKSEARADYWRENDALRTLVGQLVEALRGVVGVHIHHTNSSCGDYQRARDALAAAAKVLKS
jgi:hypothetical protein